MRTGPLRKWLLLNVECRHKSLSSRLLSSPQQILSFSSPPSSLLLFSMYTFSFCFSSPTLNFAPPQLSCYLAEVGFWLAAPWALVNSVKQPAARLCNCNEGQKERRQGTELFSRSVSRHTFPRNHSFPFFPFRPLPNYICILLSRPLSPWRGSERARLKRRKADITFACISYAAALLK